MISLMYMAEQAAKQRKSSIQFAAQKSANRRQNKNDVSSKDYVNKAIQSRNIYKDVIRPPLLMPKTRTAAQKSANRRRNLQIDAEEKLIQIHILKFFI
jgi:hypothetical protein